MGSVPAGRIIFTRPKKGVCGKDHYQNIKLEVIHKSYHKKMKNHQQPKTLTNMYPWHGFLGSKERWEPPLMTQNCDVEARPGYQTEKAHEYEDTEEVLHEKVRVLADLMTRSKHCLVYSGAGLSTASGISDYATKSNTKFAKTKKTSGYAAHPTFAHRALVAMHQKGLIKHWLQQNHDGLPQKVS